MNTVTRNVVVVLALLLVAGVASEALAENGSSYAPPRTAYMNPGGTTMPDGSATIPGGSATIPGGGSATIPEYPGWNDSRYPWQPNQQKPRWGKCKPRQYQPPFQTPFQTPFQQPPVPTQSSGWGKARQY
jgi:hypothetical protein